jgi:thermitase
MKATHFCVIAVTIVATFLGIFTLVTGFSLKEDSASANGMAAVSVTDSSSALSKADSNLLVSVETKKDGLIRPNDPFFDNQWSLEQMNITDLWNLTAGVKEVLIAILDTGIDSDHEDLQGKVVAEVNFTDSPSTKDINGHGTHVAGIICATANNGIGVAGLVPNCKILNVKVADDYGFCQEESVARGIVWAVDNGAQVINISLEIRNPSATLEQAVNYAWDHGALIIAAAGNQGNNSAVYPAYYENSIAVAATRPDDTLAPLSNYGDWVDVAAPGYNIYSTLPGNKYGYETGTSFATAYVSGLAAILSSILRDTNGNGVLNDEVRNVIESSCRQTSYANYTYNIINVSMCFQQFVVTNP